MFPYDDAITLEQLIVILEGMPAEQVIAMGFENAHSWRGDYSKLAFSPKNNTTVAAMLSECRAAVGATYFGWKGGEYVMGLKTQVYVAEHGETGIPLTQDVIDLFFGSHLEGCGRLMSIELAGMVLRAKNMWNDNR